MALRFIQESHLRNQGDSRRALRIHRYLLRGAMAGVHIFAWIFAFQYFFTVEAHVANAFVRTILLYMLSQTIICLATPYTARFLRYGARRALIYATMLAAISFTILGLALSGWSSLSAPIAITLFAILMGLYRSLYWIPYEVESEAHLPKKSPRALEFLIALVPLCAGLFASLSGHTWVLYVGTFVAVLSGIPLYFVREVREKFSWSYRETFQHLFATRNRSIAIGSILDGMSGAAMLFFWPFAILFVVAGSYGVFGMVLSITLCISIFARGIVRRLFEYFRITRSRTLRVALTASPWLLRLAVATPLGIVFADLYFYAMSPRTMGIDPVVFEQVSDGGSYVDEYTALKEIGLALGRIAICLFAVAAISIVSIPTALVLVFLVAAITSTASIVLTR